LYRKLIKPLLDRVCAFIAIVLLSPVFLVLALLIRIKLGAPVIFSQKRPGLDEKTFKLFKFRSMTNKKDTEGELLPDDERLTKFGRKLRMTSMDELPELWNILKGDMSLVGPRPLLLEYLPYYTEAERQRHTVKPGITGLAQVSGRNAVTWEEKFSFDINYIEQISFLLDLRIIVRTFHQVITKKDILVGKQHVVQRLDIERS
jgi:undecaprenyl phosphate N,N'-diacetylbacillosamine 1-phosphate transferase